MSNDRPGTLRTEAGIPVHDNQHSETAGPAGPVLLQDFRLVEKLARFNRERIPERVVHAVGSGAHGVFEVTNPGISQWTNMAMLSQLGNKTPVLVRFSTVAASKGGPDSARDPRGFAVKFYTEDGNWDLVGNNTPVFFLRDGKKFPDFIHSQKYDPKTNRQEPNNVWDFFSHSPEATHQFVWLFGDRGRPASLRHMDGFGSHTFMWTNGEGAKFWVKFHFKTDQGIECLTEAQGAKLQSDPEAFQKDLFDAIERGDSPSWTLKVQVMPHVDAASYRLNPFDLTKVWPQADYPLIEIGKMTLDRNPDNYFAEVEQAAFDPAHMPPGVGPSPDRMLQARLFAYGDAHRYRLGINHIQLPINAPKLPATNYGRDGSMNGARQGGAPNYEPNSRGGPQQTGESYGYAYGLSGDIGSFAPHKHRQDDDYTQAGALYRLMDDAAKARLIDTLSGSLAQVTLPGIVEASLAHFRAADDDLGQRLGQAIEAKRS